MPETQGRPCAQVLVFINHPGAPVRTSMLHMEVIERGFLQGGIIGEEAGGGCQARDRGLGADACSTRTPEQARSYLSPHN